MTSDDRHTAPDASVCRTGRAVCPRVDVTAKTPHRKNSVKKIDASAGLADDFGADRIGDETRLVRGMVTPALEDVALWHERDISHSSVERMIGPDATVTLDFALARLTGMIDKLIVYPENMKRNLDLLGGLHNSQRVLLALTQAGMSREDAYAAVQRNAMKVWEMRGDRAGQFARLLKADGEIAQKLSPSNIDAMFDDFYHLKHVDAIFERVFGPEL